MPRIPFTISSLRKHVSVEEGASIASSQQILKTKPPKEAIKNIEVKSPSDKSDPTFKRIGR
jgi:hypothetical protein